ncbi:MAG: molybdopterin-binding protein [Rhodomicrobiaceae bacterium]
MKFDEMKLQDAEGGILAYSLSYKNGRAKKGQIVDLDLINKLYFEGIRTVHVAKPDHQDLGEDFVAYEIANLLCGENCKITKASTGRANIYSDADGLATLDVNLLNELNFIDERLTVATCKPSHKVLKGEVVATIKVIPFALPIKVFQTACELIDVAKSAIKVAPFQKHKAGLILTKNSWNKTKVINKGECILEQKLNALGSDLIRTVVTDHSHFSVAKAILDLVENKASPILILGSCALSDRNDVIPRALTSAGGDVVHVGMPVEPGNLLMFGNINSSSVIGVPTCARSHKLNGFDWILQQVLCGQKISSKYIMSLGVGGLIK